MKYNDMKTNKHYLMSAMNLITAPTANVSVAFQADMTFTGKLEDLALWAKENKVGVMKSCLSEGLRHGLFPCILADCPRVAAALSVYSGYEVAVGDGRSFFTRKDALAAYVTLSRAGIPMSPEYLVWAITETPYAKPEAPKSQQPSLAEQYAELPF